MTTMQDHIHGLENEIEEMEFEANRIETGDGATWEELERYNELISRISEKKMEISNMEYDLQNQL